MKDLVCNTNHVSLLCALSAVLAAGTASAQTEISQPEVPPAAEEPAPQEVPAPPLVEPAPPAPQTSPPTPQASPPAPQASPPAPQASPPAPQPAAPEVAPAPVAAAATEPAAPLEVAAEPLPPPDSVTPLQVSGSFFSRYELRNGYQAQGLSHPRLHREGDNIVYRARLGLSTNPVSIGESSSVRAVFVPQAYGTHATQGAPATIGDGYDLGVYEAYVGLAGERLQLAVGRFEMNYGDALVIGNLGWNEAARAFQGARLKYSSPKEYWIDFFATLINEGRPATAGIGDGDRYFYGAYAGLGGLIGEMDLDVYFLGQSTIGREVNVALEGEADDFLDLEGASEFTLGARAKQSLGLVDYRAEAGVQFGTVQGAPGGPSVDKLAFQVDAELGVAPAKGLRFAVGGLVASGDDVATADKSEAWNQLYPTTHKFLGLADIFGGRSNALSANAKLSYKAADSLILKLDGHLLSRQVENAAGESFVGSEIDFNVISPIGKGAVVRAMYAAFLPNEDFWPEDSAIQFLEVQFGYAFK